MSGKEKGKDRSRSARANLQFPVGRIHRFLRKGKYADRVGACTPVYLAAVLEYLASEVLKLAVIAARDRKKIRIIPKYIEMAVKTDKELSELFSGVIIPQGGVQFNIQQTYHPTMTEKKK